MLADGRVYTGRQALKVNLIDEIGGEENAIAWLEREKDIASGTKVVNWALSVNIDPTGLGFSVADGVLKAMGLGGLRQKAESAKLDGLLVLWHPAL